ncbi:MAG: hypothetical protein MZV63_72120 [Marinilabiliales bacterium]|nr:hypothetical protein [Marinilabiliales bacterium]
MRDKVKAYYDDAMAQGYQTKLFGPKAKVETNYEYEFSYPTDPFQYPAHWYYKGGYIWSKNYYPLVGELESDGEEFECAQAIDRNMAVKCWVRNLSKSDISFKLPTSSDYFYPDFTALLNDGRISVVEYKGKPYETNDDSKEKMNIGELWNPRARVKGLFLMAVKKDSKRQGRLQADRRQELAESFSLLLWGWRRAAFDSDAHHRDHGHDNANNQPVNRAEQVDQSILARVFRGELG